MLLRRQLTALIVLSAITTMNSFSINAQEYSQQDPSETTSLMAWNQGNKRFASSFYPQLKNGDKNFVFSPISLQLAFSMASEMAFGETLQQIVDIVGLPQDEQMRRDGAREVMQVLHADSTSGDNSTGLLLANGAWLSSELSFREDLRANLVENYQAQVEPVDFKNSSEEARQGINAWVEGNTCNLIRDFIPKGSINRLTKLVLVNTLYMKAPWKFNFEKTMSYQGYFYGKERTIENVTYMHKISSCNVMYDGDCIVVELPFEMPGGGSSAVSLFAVLPRNESLEVLEASLTPNRLDRWMANRSTVYTDLHLPKFKISSTIDAKPLLQTMGMTLPFSQAATFDIDGKGNSVAIDKVLQNAVFEVDEWGGTGAAATAIIFKTTSSACRALPKYICFSRPFLVIVADKTTGTVLFAGRVMDPTAN